MNESTLTQLKIIVERAVRPVRASTSRKGKMREEILAHVVGVFEEEAARLGGERAALERTALRFGNPAEVTSPLQESVPAGDRSGESALRLAAGFAAVFGALGFVPLGIMILIHGWLPVAARVPSPFLWIPLCMAFLAFCSTLLIQGMRQALFGPAGRSWLRAGLVAAAAWIVIPVTTFAVCLAVLAVFLDITRKDLETCWWEIVPLWPQGVLVPVVMVAVTYLVNSECRHAREWASLQID